MIASQAAGNLLSGQSISPGLAVGVAFVHRDILDRDQFRYRIDSSQIGKEFGRIKDAINKVSRDLASSADRVEQDLGKELAQIFLAHQSLLRDPKLAIEFREELQNRLVNSEDVVKSVMSRHEQSIRALDDDVLSQRGDDIGDLTRRLLRALTGVAMHSITDCPDGSVLVAHNLLPSETVHLSHKAVLGVVVTAGGQASHAALLTREMGIPAVANLPNLFEAVQTGDTLLVDGFDGCLVVNPDTETRQKFESRLKLLRVASAKARQKSHSHAVTADGVNVEVMANIGCRTDAENAVNSGADGVGLYRVEHIYMSRNLLPSEDELFKIVQRTLSPLQGRPATVRLLDTGGDKIMPFLDLPHEPNPFLGRRGIRFLLAYPDLINIQVRALLRLSTEFDLRILVPMVTIADEMAQIKAIVATNARQLGIKRLPPLGAMIETPAAALCVGDIVAYADFLSIGTNDLTQYTMVAGRENPLVADYFRSEHPAVLRLIRMVCEESEGKPVSVCGELASRTDVLKELLSYGIRTVSVAPPLIPQIKAAIRETRMSSGR